MHWAFVNKYIELRGVFFQNQLKSGGNIRKRNDGIIWEKQMMVYSKLWADLCYNLMQNAIPRNDGATPNITHFSGKEMSSPVKMRIKKKNTKRSLPVKKYWVSALTYASEYMKDRIFELLRKIWRQDWSSQLNTQLK